MLQNEDEDKFAGLNAQLEELKNKKPKIIVREIKVDKKGRKL